MTLVGKGAKSRLLAALNTRNSAEAKIKRAGRQPGAALRDSLLIRSGHQCEYVDPKIGRRCAARSNLQIEHVRPFALGGENDAGNLMVLCRSHNIMRAERVFGAEHMKRQIARTR